MQLPWGTSHECLLNQVNERDVIANQLNTCGCYLDTKVTDKFQCITVKTLIMLIFEKLKMNEPVM